MSSEDKHQPPPPIFDDDEDIFSTPTALPDRASPPPKGTEEDEKQPADSMIPPAVASSGVSNSIELPTEPNRNDFDDPLFADVQHEIDLDNDDKSSSNQAQLLLDDSSNDQETDNSVEADPAPPKLDIQQTPPLSSTIPETQDDSVKKEPLGIIPSVPQDKSTPAQLPSVSPFTGPGPSKPLAAWKPSQTDEDVSNVPGFTKKEYVVWRRFSDFLGLHDKLAVKHSQGGRIVPPPPEKSVVGMTKTKMAKGNTEEDVVTNEFLEKRRASLERYLRRTSQHPVLLQDPDFRDFLTLETELPKSTQTSAMSGAGVKRIITRVGDAISKMAYRMDETDRWFEEKQNEIEELDESLRKLHSSVEMLVHFRKELAGSTDSFSKSMCMLAACEENTALSRAFSQLAETQEKVGLLQHDQADKDFYILSEMLKDYVALIGTVKEVFYERVKVWQNWQSAQQSLTKKREVKTRLELAGKSDKLPAAKKDVQDYEQKVQELEEEFEVISKMIQKEMKRFDAQRIRDFKHTMLQYLESLSLTQQQCIKYWEAFLPEAKAIIS